jgi:hypothetical protein
MNSPLPGKPLVWSPSGASDTLDSSTAPDGAMALLSNLIPDPTTKNLWQCRPAAILLAAMGVGGPSPFSSGFSSGFGATPFMAATFVSCWKVVGTRLYGMISTGLNAGHDQPFAFDLVAGVFLPISGITNANTPVSPQTSGAWVPPNMDLIGVNIIVAHPGFSGAGGAFFGVINTSNPAALTWTAQNTTTNALVAPPQWVSNFNGRCFFLVNPPGAQPAAYMSDQLNALNITNASQILTFGDNVPLTAAAGLPLENQLGGIVQSLMIFKSSANIYQITGDFSLTNLAVNSLNVATGTNAPLTIASTSKGLAFVAPDGVRMIDFDARVSDPIGADGQGINVPFTNIPVPSRACGAYNSGVYRVQIQNGNAPGIPQQQWWFDFVRTIWSGPHTQTVTQITPYAGTFLVVLANTFAAIWQSDSIQSINSIFTENGTALQWQWATPMLPEAGEMSEIAMIETTLMLAVTSGSPVNVSAQDQTGRVIDSVTITPSGATSLWGAFTWGAALWQSVVNALFSRQMQWHFPLVFKRIGIVARGASSLGVKIGRLHLRYQTLGYLQQSQNL